MTTVYSKSNRAINKGTCDSRLSLVIEGQLRAMRNGKSQEQLIEAGIELVQQWYRKSYEIADNTPVWNRAVAELVVEIVK
jgi:hypothetical protein